jgi:hypothetical protein
VGNEHQEKIIEGRAGLKKTRKKKVKIFPMVILNTLNGRFSSVIIIMTGYKSHWRHSFFFPFQPVCFVIQPYLLHSFIHLFLQNGYSWFSFMIGNFTYLLTSPFSDFYFFLKKKSSHRSNIPLEPNELIGFVGGEPQKSQTCNFSLSSLNSSKQFGDVCDLYNLPINTIMAMPNST